MTHEAEELPNDVSLILTGISGRLDQGPMKWRLKVGGEPHVLLWMGRWWVPAEDNYLWFMEVPRAGSDMADPYIPTILHRKK